MYTAKKKEDDKPIESILLESANGMYLKKKIKKKKIVDPNRPNLLNHEKRMKTTEEQVEQYEARFRHQQVQMDRMERLINRQAVKIGQLESAINRLRR